MSRSPMVVSVRRLITDPDEDAIAPGAVVVDGDRIVDLGTLDAITERWERVERVDLGDVTLVPGFVDCHVHLCYGGEGKLALGTAGGTESIQRMLESAERLVTAGVTTARDLGAPRDLGTRVRSLLDESTAVGPRLVVANAPLTSSGGHAWDLGGECSGVAQLRQAVRRRRDEGADLVKLMVTGGGTTPGSQPWHSQFTHEEVEAVVEEARQFTLPVAAHTHGTAGIVSALRGGASTLEHCTWMGPGGVIGAEWDDDVAEEIARSKVPVCPTASALWDGMAPERRRAKVDTVRRMHEAGIELVAGTDAGVRTVAYDDYARGLELLAECGLPPAAVIAAATKRAAAAIGLGAVTGTISMGKSADLVAVDGDPLADVSVLRRVRWVMGRGRVLFEFPALR